MKNQMMNRIFRKLLFVPSAILLALSGLSQAFAAQRQYWVFGFSIQRLLLVWLVVSITFILIPQVQAGEITVKAVTTATVQQYGQYKLWNNGNSHGWLTFTLSPNAGDGYAYKDWTLSFDLSSIPPGSILTTLTLTIARKDDVPAPLFFVRSYPFGYLDPITQSIKYFTPDYGAFLSFVASGPTQYKFPVPQPRNNSITINVLALGLGGFGDAIAQNRQLQVSGTLQYFLGRAYLGDLSQKGKADPEWTTFDVYGGAGATVMGSLDVEFIEPTDIALVGVPGSAGLYEATPNGRGSFTILDHALDHMFANLASRPGNTLLTMDVNQDGLTDLVLIIPGIGGFYSESANGDGTFRIFAQHMPDVGAAALDPQAKMVTGHFTNDGRPGLLIFGNSTAVLALGNRDGTFSQVPTSVDPAFAYNASQPGVSMLTGIFR